MGYKRKDTLIHKEFVLGDLGGDLGVPSVEDKEEEDQELKISINFIVSCFSLCFLVFGCLSISLECSKL